MRACTSCKMMIQTLKIQIQELSERQSSLKRINNSLMEAVSLREQQSREQVIWKRKWEEQIRQNQELEQKIKELEEKQNRSLFCHFSHQTQNKTYRSRKNSLHQMDQLMKTINFSSKKSNHTKNRTMSIKAVNKGDIILRIVDQRQRKRY